MRVIELLGPSGVGKTFLYQRLFETYTERRYMNVKEACIRAAEDLKLEFEFTRYYIYYLLFKSGLFKFKAYGLSKRLLIRDKNLLDVGKGYGLSFELLKKYLLTESNSNVSSKRMENFRRCAQLNFLLEKHLQKKEVVFFDEGALHYHHGLNTSIAAQHTSDIKKDRTLSPYAVVSCELSFEQLMDRVMKRKIAGVQTFSHKDLSGVKLEAYVHQNMLEYREKVKALNMAGVPILTINTDDNVFTNLKTVHSFINNLI
jgi:hypothetical protein